MIHRRVVIATVATAAAALGALAACGGSSNNSGGSQSPGNITISAQLVSGSVTTTALTEATAGTALMAPRSAQVTVLSGFKLYCVTFQSPPAAASGVADGSGNVSVTLAAKGVAFGCFIRDSSDNTIATLSFQSAGANGTTLTLNGDGNLGSVTVDTTTGLATATATTGTVASTPAAATCPTGYWVVQTGSSSCSTTPTTAKVWITPNPAGGYLATIVHGPSMIHNTNTCGYESFGSVPVSYNGSTRQFTVGPFNTNGSCNQMLTVVLQTDASCSTATASASFQNCTACGSGGDVCSGGGSNNTCSPSVTCTATWPAVKQ